MRQRRFRLYQLMTKSPHTSYARFIWEKYICDLILKLLVELKLRKFQCPSLCHFMYGVCFWSLAFRNGEHNKEQCPVLVCQHEDSSQRQASNLSLCFIQSQAAYFASFYCFHKTFSFSFP